MTLLQAVQSALSDLPPDHGPVLVACSGGGDSIALLYLTCRALGAGRVACATVNHNLRPEAAGEAALVARHCDRLGVPHHVLDWHWDGQGNLQAAAREGRRAALGRLGFQTILLGHTADDVTETFLMRLARGSGVDGLAAMAQNAPPILRPLLGLTRAEIRTWLTQEGLDWAEDPSNDDPRFDRVRARALAQTLGDLGLTQERILQTAAHMAGEAEVLQLAARQWVETHVTEDRGDLIFDKAALEAAPASLAMRVLSAGIMWIGSQAYRPRHKALQHWCARLSAGEAAPLAGVLGTPETGVLRLSREPSAVEGKPRAGDLWDSRWQLLGLRPQHDVRPLGEALSELPNWRDTGLPRPSLMASPSVWDGPRLVAAPLAETTPAVTAHLVASFKDWLDSH